MASEIEFPVSLVLHKVGPGAVLAEPLLFPELARLGANRALSGHAARRNLLELIPKRNPAAFLQRRRANAARGLIFTLELFPPRGNEAWRDPLTLTFHAVVWDQANTDPPPNGDRGPIRTKPGANRAIPPRAYSNSVSRSSPIQVTTWCHCFRRIRSRRSAG